MTIAALVRGKEDSYNALFVDTGALGPQDHVAHFDKLHRLFGETYAAIVGDSTIGILALVRGRVATRKRRPNLRDPLFVRALFEEMEGARAARELFGVVSNFPERPDCTMLLVCNRAEAFYWRVEHDPNRGGHQFPEAPTPLDANSMLVFRGLHVGVINNFFTIEPDRLESLVVDQMLNVNARLEAGGAAPLPYAVSRRVSGVILPHKTSNALRRIDAGVAPMPIDGLPAEATLP